MQRLPFLLIAILMIILAGAIIVFGVSYTMAPIQQQQEYAAESAHFLPLAFLSAVLLGFAIWVCALIHVLTNQSMQGTDKIAWTLVIIFLNVLGAILYFLLSPFAKAQASKPPLTPP